MPSVPEDVTELSDSSLMKLFRLLMGWQKYLATQLALAEVDEKYSSRRLARLEKGFDFRRIADKERAAKDPDYEAAGDAQQEAFAYRRVVESLHDSVSQDTFMCSRELTRRLGSSDRENRNARFNT